MELLVKIIIVCVIFSYVFAVEQYQHVEKSSAKPVDLSEQNEVRAAKLRKYIVDCTEETKVKPDLIIKMISAKRKISLKTVPQHLKEWLLCVLVKSGIMSPDGVLRQDEVLAYIPAEDREKVEQVIDKCLYEKPHSPIETAWHYVTCFRDRLSKYSVL